MRSAPRAVGDEHAGAEHADPAEQAARAERLIEEDRRQHDGAEGLVRQNH